MADSDADRARRLDEFERRCIQIEQNVRDIRADVLRAAKEQIDQNWQNLDLWTNNHPDYRRLRRVIERVEQLGDLKADMEQAVIDVFKDAGLVVNGAIDTEALRAWGRWWRAWDKLRNRMVESALWGSVIMLGTWAWANRETILGWLESVVRSRGSQ